MLRSCRLALLSAMCVPWLSSGAQSRLLPDHWGNAARTPASGLVKADPAILQECGLVATDSARYGPLRVAAYQMKDTTAALAVWEWLRPADAKPCSLAPFCVATLQRALFFSANYVLEVEGPRPGKEAVDRLFLDLPDQRQTSLPALLTFLPSADLVPNSGRYILGPLSLAAFAPELKDAQAGFDQGVEAQLATYTIAGGSVPLVLFYYPTPGLARLHATDFKLVPDTVVKRSAVLVAVVLHPRNDAQAAALLDRVQYEARITWNDLPPPSPIKPLFSLLVNILILSGILSALGITAGLIYGGMRLYRRRYGTLEADEAMTTLRLSGD